MGVESGGELVLSLDGGAIGAMTRMDAIRRVQRLLPEVVPAGVSLVDDPIAERREEAARSARE